MDKWTEALDNDEEIDCFYTDFMKAFDRVPHQRLIAKMKSYGINYSPLTHCWTSNIACPWSEHKVPCAAINTNNIYLMFLEASSEMSEASEAKSLYCSIFIPKCVCYCFK